eukprot:jgi/Orpsp1_1/1175348/evm.model.c7180000053481.1
MESNQNINQENENQENESQENVSQENENQENVNQENESQENVNQENESQENANQENENQENVNQENESQENANQENENQENENQENENQENVNQENESQENENQANENQANENQENENQNNNERGEEFGISNEEFQKDKVLKTQSIGIDEHKSLVDPNNNNNNEKVPLQKVKSAVSRTSTKNSLPPPERRTSFQVRAMLRKTLSYQKRQIVTNLCCVGLCPTIMIIIAFLLSILIEYLLRDLIKTEKYEYCTNEYNSAFVLPNGVDEFKQDDPEVHIKHYTSADTPCSSWFGSNDYFESYPYDILPENNEANINRDTTFMPSIDKTNKKGNYEYILSNINKFMGKGLLNVFVVLNEMGTYHNDAEQKEYYNKKFYEYKKKKEKEDAKKLEDMNNNNNNNDNDNNNNNDNDNNNSSSTSKLHKRADLSSLLNISPEMLNTI